ncbi:MAG: hypothetical protein IKW95_06370 [Lachnospiraceae bacterium]|nr:hypothetical protein [Lachnospiraceae bacterium]
MKKHLSVIKLLIRRKFRIVLCLLILMPPVSIGVFRRFSKLDAGVNEEWDHLINAGPYFGIVFYVAFIIMLLSFALGFLRQEHNAYTLARLRISERTVFLYDFLLSTVSLLMLWQEEVIMIFIFNRIDHKKFGAGTEMVLRIVERQDTFFQTVIPIGNPLAWLEIVFVIASCGFGASICAFVGRERVASKGIPLLIVLPILVATIWYIPLTKWPTWIRIRGLLAIPVTCYLIWKSMFWFHNGRARTEDERADCL